MTRKRPAYHHGDLYNALLEAGEAELQHTGVKGFSLRAVARRVGVSHAAPAHHFGDAQGLLEALATEGFRRFLTTMQQHTNRIVDDPREWLFAAATGYLQFATDSPALFRLMFGPERERSTNAALKQAAGASFQHLVDGVTAWRGRSPNSDASAMADTLAIWSLVHGYAELRIAGSLQPVADPDHDGFRQIFMRVLQ